MNGMGLFLRSCLVVVALGCGIAQAGESYSRTANDAYNESDSRKITNQALRYGIKGNHEKRVKLLELAIKKTPNYAPAHWALGHILQSGEWMSLASIQKETAADPRRDEYERLKERFLKDENENHVAVAKWCSKNELEDEARAHWIAVLRDDPNNRAALANVDSRWLQGALVEGSGLPSQAIEDREVLHAQKLWAKKVAKWSRSRTPRDKESDPILRQVRRIDDKNAIPAFEQLASTLSEGFDKQERAYDLCAAFLESLAEMRGSSATESLVRFAIFPVDDELRKKAANHLKDKPMEQSVPYLLTGLQPITESKFNIATDREGRVRYEHNFLTKDKEETRQLERVRLTRIELSETRNPASNGMDIQARRRMQFIQASSEAMVQAQLEMLQFEQDAKEAEEELAKSQEKPIAINKRVTTALRAATQQNFGDDPQKWWDYWSEYRGYEVNRNYQRDYDYNERTRRTSTSVPPSCECFVAGTIVYTKQGNVAIETIQPGDFVLSCEPETGELAFCMVREVTRRAPSPMLTIHAEDEPMTATVGHPFWVEAQGWRMAKQLKVGDSLMAYGRSVTVTKIEPSEDAVAYNLIVEGAPNYFVGNLGVLAHDNTPVAVSENTLFGE